MDLQELKHWMETFQEKAEKLITNISRVVTEGKSIISDADLEALATANAANYGAKVVLSYLEPVENEELDIESVTSLVKRLRTAQHSFMQVSTTQVTTILVIDEAIFALENILKELSRTT